MEWQIHNLFGWFHVITGIIAVAAATYILLTPKGTRSHRRMGWVYVVSIVILDVSAWGILEYNSGLPGPFHVGALINLFFVSLGIYPVIRRRGNWLQKHYNYINGSVMGLFAAFFVEAVFRSFTNGYVIIGLTVGISLLVMLVSMLLIVRHRPKLYQLQRKYSKNKASAISS
ncbi:hypothetical protein AHMF7605_24585 [Adhaeribacter arboris]|uniref:DUF2306 domain-containing protein n=1 Tax=Adhaeribacter arboris TaxID=2072846 RepID=A0A2T2YLS5_9BACT|nr:DUF2306 domain-containing protein [Adhaeribacter arboris]PSR56447.1 hypothetical protein AHMF7605_24585 [Adhaeribacter arboris]